MKRTNSRIIKLPVLLKPDSELASSAITEEIEEENIRSYFYGKDTGNPTLDEFPIESFRSAIKEECFEKAVQEVGLDSNGLLKESFSSKPITLNGMKFVPRAYKTTRYSHEVILSELKVFLDGVVAGSQRHGRKKVDDKPYIFIDYLLNEVERLRQKPANHTTSNRTSLNVKDPITDKKLIYESKIKKMRVYLNTMRYRTINPANAKHLYNARSLENRINSFEEAFVESRILKYDIPAEELGESRDINHDLSDGAGIRELFSQRTSTDHSKIYYGLVVGEKKTENIAASNGDLQILKELAFKDQYTSLTKSGGVEVATMTTDRNGKKGQTIIRRTSKDSTYEESIYNIFDNKGKLYLKVADVLNTIVLLTQQHTSSPTKLTVYGLVAPPAYLR